MAHAQLGRGASDGQRAIEPQLTVVSKLSVCQAEYLLRRRILCSTGQLSVGFPCLVENDNLLVKVVMFTGAGTNV